MSPSTNIQELAGLPLLAGVGDTQLRLLASESAEVEFGPGELIIERGERGESMFLLLSGALEVEFGSDQANMTIDQFGTPIGEIQLLSGGQRSATVRTTQPARLLEIPASALMALAAGAPEVLERLRALAQHRLRSSRFKQLLLDVTGPLDPEFLHAMSLDAKWIKLDRGELLTRAGEPCAGWYIIVSGQLTIMGGESATATNISVGVGETIGELSLLTDDPYPSDVIATRNTELFLVSQEQFAMLLRQRESTLPSLIKHLMRQVAGARAGGHQRPEGASNFALTPLDDSRVGASLCRELADLLRSDGEVFHLDITGLRERLDVPEHALTRPAHPAWLRVRAWFESIVVDTTYVVLEDSPAHPAWSRFCRDYADVVVGVGDGSRSPASIEPNLAFEPGEAPHAPRRLLALLHSPATALPTNARVWLARLAKPELLHLRWPERGELGRLARALTGRSIGVVLSGGNARSMAQIGALQVLEEAGVPIDMIGGTSFGAIIAGLWAMRRSFAQMRQANQDLVRFNPFRSLTLSRLGLIKGEAFDWIANHTFGEADIEDLWLAMYCVSVNFTTTEEVIHERGTLWKAVRASGSLPVMIEPFVESGQIFVDGGLVNNLPIDVMQRKTSGPLVAINVFTQKGLDLGIPTSAAESPGLLRRALNKVSSRAEFGLFDILLRSFVISSSQRFETHKHALDLLIEPEVSAVSGTQFDAFDQLVRAGRVAARDGAAELRQRLDHGYFLPSS